MKVWVLQTGEPLPVDSGNPRPMRAINLCNELCRAGHEVVLWSADFSHQEKRFRFRENRLIGISDKLQVRLIKSPGYRRNIGLMRLYDHAWLGINLHRLLQSEIHAPDVAFVGYPPIETAYVFIRWMRKRRVPVLLDVKDQWPQIFVEALPTWLRPLGSVLLSPYFYMARKSMLTADGVTSMADSFLDWVMSFSGRSKCRADRVFPLTSPTGQVSEAQVRQARRWWDEAGVPDDSRPRICFVGSLSPAFDFTTIRDAARLARQRDDDIQFVICGEGSESPRVRELMDDAANVIIAGWIDRPKIEALADRCMAALAPYVNTDNFRMNLPNKVIDALSLGLPILSPLGGEVERLVQDHEIGMHYREGDGSDLYRCLRKLSTDTNLRSSMSEKARELYTDRFSYEVVYPALVEHLEWFAKNGRAR